MELIGPYMIQAKEGTMLDVMYVTMLGPATGWFEIVELPNVGITYASKG